MANPTSNFNWQMPTPTDLVTDLPADFEVFGQAVDSSMADLLGGTTGQILAKNSNTNMDFVWIANDQGDITGITATSPLTGGGTSGAVTVGIQDATTAQKGAVQLENSTSSTSTTTAAVPASVKSAYDLADGAIAKTLVNAKGDVVTATADNTPAVLTVGANDLLLTAASGETTGLKYTGDWTTYTPTYQNLVVGNGTVTARYCQIGKQVFFLFRIVFGSTTVMSSTFFTFSLPKTNLYDFFAFDGNILDAGITNYNGAAQAVANDGFMYGKLYSTSGSYLSAGNITPTTPMTWGTGDTYLINGSYEVA
jgi:hypothetical protein